MIKEFIRSEMEKNGLSVSKLAEKAGLRRASLSDWLAGKKNLYAENTDKLLEVLNAKLVTTEELVDKLRGASRLGDLYEKMLYDIEKEGIKSNELVGEQKIASYALGRIVAGIYCNLPGEMTDSGRSYAILNKIIFGDGKNFLFDKTFTQGMIKYYAYVNPSDSRIFAYLLDSYEEFESNIIHEVKFYAAFFRYIEMYQKKDGGK